MFEANKKPIIAMLYLPAGLGHPDHLGLEKSYEVILSDLKNIHDAGFDAICLENEKDAPYKIEAERHDISFYTLLTRKVVEESRIPVGFNYLLNDPMTSLAIAKTTEAAFVRSDYYVDEMVRESDQRVMKVDPYGVKTYRQKINADNVQLYADVQVKHAQLVKKRPLIDSVNESFEYGADGVIVSGSWTGKAPEMTQLHELKEANLNRLVIIGSGFNKDNASELLPCCNGVIVGTAILDGSSRVDLDRSLSLMNEVRKIRSY